MRTDPFTLQTELVHPSGSTRQETQGWFVLLLFFLGALWLAVPPDPPPDLRDCDWGQPNRRCEALGPPELVGLPPAGVVAAYCDSQGIWPPECHTWSDPREALAWEQSFDFPPAPQPSAGEARFLKRLSASTGLPLAAFASSRTDNLATTINARRDRFGDAWAQRHAPWPAPVRWSPFVLLTLVILFGGYRLVRAWLAHRPPIPVTLTRAHLSIGDRRMLLEELDADWRSLIPLGYRMPSPAEQGIEDAIRDAKAGEDRTEARRRLAELDRTRS